jgi:hypothetical protein
MARRPSRRVGAAAAVIVALVVGTTVVMATTYTYGSTAARIDDNDTFSGSQKCGLEVDLATSGEGIRAEISGNTAGQTTAYLYQDTNGNDDSISLGTQLDSKDISSLGSGDTVNLTGTVSAGSDYVVLMDAGGSSFTQGFGGLASSSYTSADIDIVGGYISGDATIDGDYYCFDAATLITSASTPTPTPTPTPTDTATETATDTATDTDTATATDSLSSTPTPTEAAMLGGGGGGSSGGSDTPLLAGVGAAVIIAAYGVIRS